MRVDPPLAPGVSRLGTESAFEVLARARALEAGGVDVVHLEIGEPDFPTPPHVVQAAVEAMRRGETGYCPAAGIPELREAAAEYLGAPRGLAVAPDEVLVATGAKPFLLFTILACVGPGDEVVYPDPGFPIYHSVISWAGGVPVALALRERDGFAFDPDELAAKLGPRTRLVILNSPHNPTGAAMSQAQIDELAALLEPTGAWILADEVYAKIVYGTDAPSLASVPGLRQRTVLLDSCSKTFAMTGWRCGFAAVPAALREPLTRFFINSTSCVPPFVQRAAVAALAGPMDAVDEMVRTFRARRDVVVEGLNRLPGVRCRSPQGAFYAFPDVSGTGMGGAELAERLLVEAGVAVLAGSAFGEHGADHLRFSYAAALPRLQEGLARMESLLAGAWVAEPSPSLSAPGRRARSGGLGKPALPISQPTGAPSATRRARNVGRGIRDDREEGVTMVDVIVLPSAHDHAETMRRLTAAVRERGLTVFALIDHAAAAREIGLELPDEQVLIFGNPRAGTALMQDDPKIGIELPLRMLVWAGDGAVSVGYGDPRVLADRYPVGSHRGTLEAMAGLLAELASAAAGAS